MSDGVAERLTGATQAESTEAALSRNFVVTEGREVRQNLERDVGGVNGGL